MHGTARRSSKEPLHLWNVPQRSTYDDEAQSDLPGFRPSLSRMTTPSSGHYECRHQPQEQEHLGLERHQRTSTHACSPLMDASRPRKEFAQSGRRALTEASYGLSRASFPTADVLSTPTSRPTSRPVSTMHGPSAVQWPFASWPRKGCDTKPFENVEAFEEFDAEISANETMRTRLMQQFRGLGGSSIGPATRRILGILLSQEVAVQYSWLGMKGKKDFSALQVADTITRAVMQNFSTSKRRDVENVIKGWLRHSGEKLRKQQAKADTPEGSLDVHSDFSD
ncbi:uncharacterized protein LOC119431373 [Dermacentor silvarum]|uniref:uncharacterized protein LOC119431373 n=1 Tax=Dermacentor silvarum TaxID=543639 RepID=UPI00210092AF|nr:uncharacterized protein LOC119431373 [Dermacentor silvarum]